MRKHLTAETMRRLVQRDLPAPEVPDALRHLGDCPECRALAGPAAGAARVQEILAAEAAEPPQHLTFEELAAWVDGTADEDARRIAGEHLAECDLCRDEAADLERLRDSMAPRRRWIWYAAAAAAAIVALLLLTVVRWPKQPPGQPVPIVRETAPPPPPAPERTPPAPPTYARAEWAQLVAGALAKGRLPFPAYLAILRGGPERMRGETPDPATDLDPAGIVIDDTRPRLSWPSRAGATYVVSIFDGQQEVAHSDPLTARTWIPPRALPRGRTYTWQVEAKTGAGVEVLPAPPAPPARFRIISARDHDEIAAARAQHPRNALLLAALYARSGMEAEAKRQLKRLAGSRDPKVQQLLANTLEE